MIFGLFGPFQGSIMSSYTIIGREYFPTRGTSTKVGVVLAAAVVGMALDKWMTGEISDRISSLLITALRGT